MSKVLFLREYLALAQLDVIDAQSYFHENHDHTNSRITTFLQPEIEQPQSWEKWDGEYFNAPSKLGHVYWFCTMLTQAKTDGKELVVCTGCGGEMITTCALLMGCYLVLCEKEPVQDVIAAFQSIESSFLGYTGPSNDIMVELSIYDCWYALESASRLGWVNFTESAQSDDCDITIDIQEYLHYDNAANGDLHVLVPSKIIAIKCPSDVLADPATGEERLWCDVGGERLFSPTYYADVLSDFNAQLVVRCGETDYDPAAFLRTGVAVEELKMGDGSAQHLLHRIDRFLTLANLAPGPIVLHSDGTALGPAEVLVSAYLIRQHAFAARAAVAWVRIVHPGAHVPGLRFKTHPARPPSPSPRNLSRRNTIHGPCPKFAAAAVAAIAAAAAAAESGSSETPQPDGRSPNSRGDRAGSRGRQCSPLPAPRIPPRRPASALRRGWRLGSLPVPAESQRLGGNVTETDGPIMP